MTEQVQSLRIDCGDPVVKQRATALVIELTKQLKVDETIAVLTVSLHDLLVLILHNPSPMPELNVQSVTTLLDALKEQVLDHVACAHHNSEEPTERIH